MTNLILSIVSNDRKIIQNLIRSKEVIFNVILYLRSNKIRIHRKVYQNLFINEYAARLILPKYLLLFNLLGEFIFLIILTVIMHICTKNKINFKMVID